MIARRHEMAHLQSNFFRNQFRKILRWILISLIIIFVLIATVSYLILSHPNPPYYANTSEGLILAMPMVK
jgi:intracellular multiplication protein IcmL